MRPGTSLVLVALLALILLAVDRPVRAPRCERRTIGERAPACRRRSRGEREVRGPAAVRTLWGGLGGYVA